MPASLPKTLGFGRSQWVVSRATGTARLWFVYGALLVFWKFRVGSAVIGVVVPMGRVTDWSAAMNTGDRVDRSLPADFAAYARILHPFDGPGLERQWTVSWAEAAKWSGRTLHPLAQARAVCAPVTAPKTAPPFDREESADGLAPQQMRHLLPHLLSATQIPDSCYFGVWDGFGQLHGPPSILTVSSGDEADLGRVTRALEWPESLRDAARSALFSPPGPSTPQVSANSPFVLLDQQLSLPIRTFILFRGPLSLAPVFDQNIFGFDGADMNYCGLPNVWWPEDETWMIDSDIDLDSTYIGGSVDLIATILADPNLEAFPAAPSDKVSQDADTINT